MLTENKLTCVAQSKETYELYIKNSRVDRSNFKDEDGLKFYGFVLMAQGRKMQFYSAEEGLIEQWISAMSDYVVFINITNVYNRGALLGEGNFARVHECTMIDDPAEKKYAMKLIKIQKTKTKW